MSMKNFVPGGFDLLDEAAVRPGGLHAAGAEGRGSEPAEGGDVQQEVRRNGRPRCRADDGLRSGQSNGPGREAQMAKALESRDHIDLVRHDSKSVILKRKGKNFLHRNLKLTQVLSFASSYGGKVEVLIVF